MSDFFQAPPGPSTPKVRYRTPAWIAAPRGTLPGIVPIELVLARTDRVAVLRFGMQFADGSRATNTGGFQRAQRRPTPPVMHQSDGHGGGGQWRHTYRVWPLPPPGSLTLVCEWPAMNIALTEWDPDVQPILDGAERAQVIFSDGHLPEPPTRTRAGQLP